MRNVTDGTEVSLDSNLNLKNTLESFINDATWLQSSSDTAPKEVQSTDESHKALNLVTSKDQPKIVQEHSLSFVFKEDELVQELNEIVVPNKMYFISSHNHRMSFRCKEIVKDSGEKTMAIKFYDPSATSYNPELGSNEIVFNNFKDFVKHLRKAGFPMYKEKELQYMPITLRIFDREGQKHNPYPTSSDLVEKYLKSDIDRHNKKDGLTPLNYALYRSDTVQAKYLLSRNAKVTQKSQIYDDLFNSLEIAILEGNFEVVQLLVRENKEFLENRNIPFKLALENRKYDIANFLKSEWSGFTFDISPETALDLLINNIEIIKKQRQQNTAFDVELLDILTRLGVSLVDLNKQIKAKLGVGLLGMVVSVGDVAAVKFLTSQVSKDFKESRDSKDSKDSKDTESFDLSKLTLHKNTLFINALSKGQYQFVKFLIEELDCDINSVLDERTRVTPLMLAAKARDSVSVRYLIDKGAKIDQKDANGFTALMHACASGSTNSAQFLIENKADINARSNTGDTAISLALAHEKFEVLKLLINIGLKTGALAKNNLLLLAAKSSPKYFQFVIKELGEKSIDFNLKNEKGESLLQISINSGKFNNAIFLIASGVNIDFVDDFKSTPLLQAVELNNIELVKAILNSGQISKDYLLHKNNLRQNALMLSKSDPAIHELLLNKIKTLDPSFQEKDIEEQEFLERGPTLLLSLDEFDDFSKKSGKEVARSQELNGEKKSSTPTPKGRI